MKEHRIFMEVIELKDGNKLYSVCGGLKNDGQVENFYTPKECLDEIKDRIAYTFLEM